MLSFMDRTLVAWARAIKARRRRAGPPPLWLFSDPVRTPDLLAAIAALPPGLCGVVFRHDALPRAERLRLLAAAARACRARRVALVAAGPPVPGIPRHLRDGRGSARHPAGPPTASAHGRPALRRAARAGAACAFLSPAFPTASHPGAPALGVLRWAALARRAPLPVMALGGIDGRSARRLPRWAAGAGAIGALHP